MTRLIFGCGYLGERVARLWLDPGKNVRAVTRSPQRAAVFAQNGLELLVADIADKDTLASLRALPAPETVLFAVGFDRSPGQAVRDVCVEGLRNVLDALPAETGKVIYISTTGVFGDAGGEWVNEDFPCRPTRETSGAMLDAERLLQQHALGPRAIILRLAGIYGPGRVPNAEALRSGDPIAVNPEGFLNLVHVDDAARAVLAVADRAVPPRMYVVADGNPVRRSEFYAEAARLLDAPPPRFAAPDPGTAKGRRSEDSRRVSSARLTSELDFTFRYPSYREGLRAILS
ncbi:MAG: SDR family oxidoreductase [Planctomycetia bacterium]|nr:SDR family oxidoreductase [Planctomycetia bacterium]